LEETESDHFVFGHPKKQKISKLMNCVFFTPEICEKELVLEGVLTLTFDLLGKNQRKEKSIKGPSRNPGNVTTG